MKELIRVGIVGGGISGLTAAYVLDREAQRAGLPLEVHLFEKSDRLGGVIRTQRRHDYLLEWGPENFVPFKPQIMELIRDLGLSDEVIGSNDDKRRTYVCAPAGLLPLPDGMAFLTPVDPVSFFKTRLLTTSGKLRAMLEPLIPRSRGPLSVRDFLARRLGREFTERVAEPLVSSIYGGDIGQLSAGAALASTYALEQKHGSLWKGMRQAARRRNGERGSMFYTFQNGMSDLVRALETQFPPETVHLNSGNLELSQGHGKLQVKAANFEGRLDGLAICTPAPAASRLVQKLLPQAAAKLAEISCSSTSLVYLAYRREHFSHPLDGFGFVAQRDAAQVLDACTWVSSKFEGRCPPDRVLMRCAVHDGRWQRSARPDEELADSISRELKRILGITCEPDFWQVHHVPKGMPQPDLTHSRRLKEIQNQLDSVPGLCIAGGYSGGIGIPDCVASATKMAQGMLQKWFPGQPQGG